MQPIQKFCLILLGNFIVFPSLSAEYSIQPILGITSEIEDNKRLLVNDALVETTIGLRTQAELQLIMLSEDTSIYITPKIRVNRYSEEIGLDTEDKLVDFDLTHLLSEQHQVGLSAGYSIEAVSTSSTIIDPVSLSAAGLSFNEVDQERLRFSPSYTYFYDERTSFQTRYSHTDVEYDGSSGDFIDYTFSSISLTGTHVLSETDTVSAQIYRTENRPAIPTRTINNAFQITYAKDFSETLRASAGLGLTFSESETTFQTLAGPVTVDSSDVGELVSLSLIKEFEKTTFSAGFERQVSPTSQGNERINDDISFNLSQIFSERLNGNIGLRYIQSENSAVQAGSSTVGSEYFSLSTNLRYQLSRKWDITAGYQFRRVEDVGVNNERDSNGVFVTLRYVADKFVFH